MALIVRVQGLNVVKIRFSCYKRYLLQVNQCKRTLEGAKLVERGKNWLIVDL